MTIPTSTPIPISSAGEDTSRVASMAMTAPIAQLTMAEGLRAASSTFTSIPQHFSSLGGSSSPSFTPCPNFSSGFTIPHVTTASSSRLTTAPISAFHGTLSQTCAVKLTRSNYLMWKFTVLPQIRGHKLEGFLLGTKPRPPEVPGYLHGVGGTVNPAIEDWDTTDQLLMGWLVSSMTEEAVIEVIGCTTSAHMWTTLEMLFNNQSESRMLEFKTALARSEKGSQTMSAYLAQMKSYSDNLTAAGYPISNSELILSTLGGLDKDYESVIVNITARVGSMTCDKTVFRVIFHAKSHSIGL